MNSLKHYLLKFGSIVCHSNEGKIIFYHDVHAREQYTSMSTSVDVFLKHLEVIHQRNYQIVDGIPEKKEVKITFDDGWAGIWDCREEFVKRDLHPTIFIAVDLIGQPGHLTKEQIIELQKLGFVFESHTWSHRDLTQFSADELKHELLDSRGWLSNFLGKNVKELCFPIGYYSDFVLQEAFNAGYETLYSSIPGTCSKLPQPNVLTRNLVQFYTPEEVGYVLNGGLIPFYRIYQKRHCRN